MKTKFLTALITLFAITFSLSAQEPVKIGVFADCQYCDCDPAMNRYYRNSLQKLTECITEFNSDKEIKFVVGLGDLIDRDFVSFISVNTILDKSKRRVYNVTGNHDLEVEAPMRNVVPRKLGMKNTYYTVIKENWQFIFLDGNEITTRSNDPEIVEQANLMMKKLRDEGKRNGQAYNGGISEKQLHWMEEQLKTATRKNRNVILFCHFPLLPATAEVLWNAEELIQVLEKYSCVKAWINGHNHAGNYAEQNGIHYINLKGMVDTENQTAYSIITFSDTQINIDGFGREESKTYFVKQ
jgi:manganese-dependent ADP-ribose/CDP-alcohol diphosphatase